MRGYAAFGVSALVVACSSFGADTGGAGSASDGGAAPTADGGAGHLVAFVTVGSYPNPGTALVADTLCRTDAEGRLPGTFVAWYPDGTTPAPDRLVTRQGAKVDGPWYRVDGKLLAENRAALVSTATKRLASPMGVTASGGSTSGAVWTFTLADGRVGKTCPSSTTPTLGSADRDDTNWTDETFFGTSCNLQAALYCFQVE